MKVVRTNLQNYRFNSVCMQGSVTAVLVSRFASWWQEEPNIIKIIETLFDWGAGVEGWAVWGKKV